MLNNHIETESTTATILETVEELEKEQAEENKESFERDYSIYIHFKTHPASGIASFSALVAVITFFAQLMTYIINKNVLEYWGYNVSYSSLGSDSLLYSAISAIVYGLVLALTVMWFLKTSDVYFERKRYFLTVKYLLKKQHKCEKENLKMLKLVEESEIEDVDQIETIKTVIINTNEEIRDLSNSIKKDQVLARLTFIKNLIPILFLSAFSAFVMSLMLTQDMELWLTTICILIIQLVTFAILYFMEHKSVLKKKQIEKSVETSGTKEILDSVRYKTQYPLENLRSKNKGIKNSTFFLLTAYILVTCILFVASFGYSAKDNEAKRKTFEVVNLNGDEYVVVYHDKDACFLEKANSNDDELTIYINHQRIVDSSDVSFTVKTFDKIIRDNSEVLP